MGPDLPFFDVCVWPSEGGAKKRGKHHRKGKDVSLCAARYIIRNEVSNV